MKIISCERKQKSVDLPILVQVFSKHCFDQNLDIRYLCGGSQFDVRACCVCNIYSIGTKCAQGLQKMMSTFSFDQDVIKTYNIFNFDFNYLLFKILLKFKQF